METKNGVEMMGFSISYDASSLLLESLPYVWIPHSRMLFSQNTTCEEEGHEKITDPRPAQKLIRAGVGIPPLSRDITARPPGY